MNHTILTYLAYSVFISQLVRYLRPVSGHRDSFIRGQLPIPKILSRAEVYMRVIIILSTNIQCLLHNSRVKWLLNSVPIGAYLV